MAKVTDAPRRFSDPEILHINLKLAEPIIEELHVSPHRYIEVAVKKKWEQAHYRVDCMNGRDHPLSIEREHYMLTTIHTSSMDSSLHDNLDSPVYMRPGQFSDVEIEFINSIHQRPEIEWAIDNSFDGIYVQKYNDNARFATSFKFAVYMKEEQVTFWRLKFSGR